MISWLVDRIFSWEVLRVAIFAEVDFYNSIRRSIEDPESMKTAVSMWCEPDGWRGWAIKPDNGYFFNDVPEKDLSDLMDIIMVGHKGYIV